MVLVASARTDRSEWVAYRSTQSIADRNRIALENDGLALEIAHRMNSSLQIPGLPFEDMVQLGRIGLLKAVQRYNPEKGAAFSSFAVPYIQGEILHWIRDHGSLIKIPRSWRELYAKGQRAATAFREVDPAARPTDQQLSAAINVDYDLWRQIQAAHSCQFLEPLEALGDRAPDSDGEIDTSDEIGSLLQNLARLRNPYRTAIAEHFFQGMKLRAIARRHRVASDQVQQWIDHGLLELRRMGESDE